MSTTLGVANDLMIDSLRWRDPSQKFEPNLRVFGKKFRDPIKKLRTTIFPTPTFSEVPFATHNFLSVYGSIPGVHLLIFLSSLLFPFCNCEINLGPL